MRSKRDENSTVTKKPPLEGAVDKKRTSANRSTTRRNQENGGEALVRFINVADEQQPMGCFMYPKNPFTVGSPNANEGTTDTAVDFTKFHLEDDEMLMELMIHLHADCPDLMNDKADLIDRVSKLYDKLQKT
jgi:hypothetical protein